MKKMKWKIKFAVKMSHFLPNLVSEKNAKCKNAKKDFCKFQTGKETRMKKNEIEKMQKFFFANFAPFKYSDWNSKFDANCVLRLFQLFSAFGNGFVFERWQDLDQIWDWLPEQVCSLERKWVVERAVTRLVRLLVPSFDCFLQIGIPISAIRVPILPIGIPIVKKKVPNWLNLNPNRQNWEPNCRN